MGRTCLTIAALLRAGLGRVAVGGGGGGGFDVFYEASYTGV